MSSIHYKVNCGYARVAIWQLSELGKGKKYSETNYEGRNEKFKALFEPLTAYGCNSSIFNGYEHRECPFNRYCKSVNGLFQKWKAREAKQNYIRAFSTENWKKLPVPNKRRHTMSNCKECAIAHKSMQAGFPGPVFNPSEVLSENVQSLIHQNATMDAPPSTTARQILAEIQPAFQKAYGFTFTDSLANCPGSSVQLKLTDSERKAQKRKIQRECRDSTTEQLHQCDALTVLSEGQSLQSHKRMRMSQSYETPEQKRERASSSQHKTRKHSPKFDNVQWDKEGVLNKLKNWPEGKTINWSEIAREFNIPGLNGGQTVKEFASENGIDVFDLDKRPPNTRIRARKLRMPGGEVSVPTHRTEKGIKEDWQKMIESGELTLGEPCYPHKIIRYTVHDGELKQTEATVYGRKIPLLELREKLLEKHQPFMYLHTDEQLLALNKSELMEVYTTRKLKLPSEISEDALRENLKEYERTRTIGLWHDHSSILGHGYVLVTMKVFYDPAVFKDDEDVKAKTQVQNVQAYVEEPEVHILAMSSSTTEDQAALVEDRLACIKQMNTVITTNENIAIKDRLMFFSADKPAAQFERGTQQGGNYPCGSCGVHAQHMDDFTHNSNLQWRSLHDIQALVLKGPSGKKAGSIKPFDNLSNDQLKQELRARGCYEFGKRKDDLVCSLKQVLKGVQRVPSLLLQNPSQTLQEINLQNYTIMDCEPLHDLKGHLSNLLEEFPKLLDESLARGVTAVIHADLGTKETKRGGDYRLTLVHVLALLKKTTPPAHILLLIETAVDISESLYAEEAKRSPKAILRLYNSTWLHFELCSELLSSTSTLSHRRMFGVYLHSITFHAPQQYEIINLKATNTEHEERLFGQAKDMVHKATNRQPHNVIPNILLRLQAKQKRGDMYKSYYACSSRVSKAHRELKEGTANTTVTKDFLTGRMSSWQEHLKRISLFLRPGEGVWWQPTAEGYEFFDGTKEPDSHQEGPELQHFRDVTLQQIYNMKKSMWQELCEENIILPTPYIKLYSTSGEYMGRRTFDEHEITVQEDNIHSPFPVPDDKDTDKSNQQSDDQVVLMDIDGPPEEDDDDCQPDEEDMGEDCQLDETNNEDDLDIQQVDSDEHPIPDTVNDRTEEQGTTERKLKTKFAIALSKVFGSSPKLHKLDKIRYRLKRYTKNAKLVSKHKDLMASFKQDLQLKLETSKKELKHYESEQYSTHHQLPSQTDLHYREQLQSIKFITRLLRSPDFSV